MALGDRLAWLFSQSSALVSIHLDEVSSRENEDPSEQRRESEMTAGANPGLAATSMAYLPQTVFLRDSRHEGFEECVPMGPSESGFVSKWRPMGRMKTGCVALVVCLNIGVDPPDVIKISPCARMECWIDPFSVTGSKCLDRIGKALHAQYEGLQPRARYGLQLDPTVEEVKKLCCSCRKHARSERVLFHYNGHGVPKPTANGDIWVFNKNYTQYITLPISELASWLKTPSIYVFDCSAAGIVVNALIERQECNSSGASGSSKDCILLAACEAHKTLPQSDEFPADVFTSCLTTPIKMALHWFRSHSLLHDVIDHSLVEKIPGHRNDRKTLLGELNWIFTAITDSIAWNVLPYDLFQRLFRQDLLVASLFRNFLLAERIMRTTNCTPLSYPLLPSTHQHHMWDAWDMAVEICLSKLPQLVSDPTFEFQPSPFFTEQLTAFEVWLDHGSEHKKPPEQLPIVLQSLHSQSHRFRALVLLGRFLDLGYWAVDQALSVGIFPYVLKLLQSTAMELRQIIVFIWTKILSLDNVNYSFQVDLVKDGGHMYFIKFLDSMDAYPEQQTMAAFVLSVIVDGHRLGQEACIQANLIHVCLKHLQLANPSDAQTMLLLQWLCLCLGKLWEDFHEAQLIGLQADAPAILSPLLLESQPEVRAAAIFSLSTLIEVGSDSFRHEHGDVKDCDVDEKSNAELRIVKSLMQVIADGSPLVRAEVAIGLARFGFGRNKHLKSIADAYMQQGSSISSQTISVTKVESDGMATIQDRTILTESTIASTGIMHGSPVSADSSQYSDSGIFLKENATNGDINHFGSMPLDSAVYSDYVVAISALANDPSPRIATLGRRALAIIGIEHVVVSNVAKYNDGSFHQGDLSCQSASSTVGLTRSSSWFDMHTDKLPMTIRTPPVNPSSQDYLTGLRRVCSLEFRPHLVHSQDTGQADPLLGSIVSFGTSERLLPRSSIYKWNREHFSRPLLNASDENEDDLVTREQKEKIALDGIAKCKHSCITQFNNQVASWDTRFETGAKATILLPFSPIVVAADENERIRVWNYEDATQLNSFDNHNSSNRGVSKLCLVNELDDSLLLVASNQGNIRIWKDFTLKGREKLVTAFSSILSHRTGVLASNAVVDWQQQSGYLYASTEISSILLWDLDKEQNISSISSSLESCISALSASQVRGGQIVAGFVDGSVRIFDVRTPDMPVCSTRLHTQKGEKVVGIGFLPGLDLFKIVSASQAGDIQFLDIRNHSEAYLTIDAHRGSLTSLAIHRHAPVIASGSTKQIVKVFSLDGEQRSIIKYYPTLMAQRIGSVNCLNFHPYKALLAVGAADACVSIYADNNYEAR